MASIDPVSITLFIITLLLVMLIIYVATRLVTKEEVLSSPYIMRLFVTALIIVIIVPILTSLLGDFMNLGGTGELLAIIISFLILVVIMRYVIVSEASLGNEWIEAIGITLICIVFTYVFNLGLSYIGQEPLFFLF
jgi:hypothetical protein